MSQGAREPEDYKERESQAQDDLAVSGPAFIPPAFVRAVSKDVLAYFQGSPLSLQSSVRSNLAKFWFTPPATVHYELWLHHGRNLIELGLHFEDKPELNARLYAYFSGCTLEIQEELGDSIWVEEWDKGWTRLYEVRRMYPLTEEKVADTAARICELIQALQPHLDRFFDSERKAPK